MELGVGGGFLFFCILMVLLGIGCLWRCYEGLGFVYLNFILWGEMVIFIVVVWVVVWYVLLYVLLLKYIEVVGLLNVWLGFIK